ncbi:uncharacterized protein [Eurosta solidaginis]|uniref:uncharacterized protein isoform X2 n=1 Tax=Eurosta solidaginis TaxID=178769 RepID=UPI0035311E30
MASARILQHYDNTRTTSETKSTQLLRTTTSTNTITKNCYARYTSGTTETCLYVNKRKNLTGKLSTTSVTTTKTSATVTSNKASTTTSLSPLLSSHYSVPSVSSSDADNAWPQSASNSKSKFIGTTKQHKIVNKKIQQKLQDITDKPSSIWKQIVVAKEMHAQLSLPQISECLTKKDDVHAPPFVASARKGRSKSADCEQFKTEKQLPKQKQRNHNKKRCHSASKGEVEFFRAKSTSNAQKQQQLYHDAAVIFPNKSIRTSKMSAEYCKERCKQAITYTHITQTKYIHNNNNTTKCCQPKDTKQMDQHDTATSECSCCCYAHTIAPGSFQTCEKVSAQSKQIQESVQSNDFKESFMQSFATVNNNYYNCNRCIDGVHCIDETAVADFDDSCAALCAIMPMAVCSTYLATLRSSVRSKLLLAAADLQALSRALFSLIIIFNMLPLFYAECDQTFVSRIGGPQNGTFTAPLLHNHKNHSRQCLYTFLAGPGQRVEVLFTSFNLRGSPPDGSAVGELPACVHEYMDIYSEVQSSDPAELINSPFGGRYCGTIPPRRRISMYRAIAISFFTNKNVSTPDLFEGTYRFINASEYEIGIPIAGSPCSYTITPSMSINKTGALISPTYPGAYPKDMSCTYQFLGESNQRVRLEFRDFDLFFGGPHCPFDYVKVYDGPDNSSALIGTYCGQQRNLVLYSSESSLFVHFYTLPRTANTQNRGFKGIYEFSESFVKLDFIRENDGIHIRGSECDQKILSRKESTGYVLSPNYPYPYIPKTVCRYFIYGMQDAQHLERVRLEFSAFNIPKVEHKDKSESNCTDGYLKIYLKGQETADAYDKFDYELCGNETQRVLSDGPRLAMVFSSGELQGRGFKGKYTFETEYKIPGTAAPDGTCSFTYVSTSRKRGELNSPRYPSNYPSDTNCSYLFLGEPNEQVTIVFDNFKIKADGNSNATAGAYGSSACFEDWLEMYVVYRDNNDRFLGRYCGLTSPGPVESPRGAVGLRITLHTDQENVASGFKARYFFEAPRSDVGECGGNFSNQDSGIITSPNYPAGYKAPSRNMASMACNWIMTARPGYKLSINFEHFSIEGDPAHRGCPAAVLRLWVNVDSDQPPLELCGEKPLIEQWYYISTGQTVRISFTTSDKTVGAPGFRIVWTEIQDSGPGPPSIGLLCESTYHFQCEVGYCISDKLRCDGVKNCGPGDDSDELHCTAQAPEEDHGVLIIITLIVVSFLICLLCTLYHSRRKRRAHIRQLGLHRNAHYDSQTSATVFKRF